MKTGLLVALFLLVTSPTAAMEADSTAGGDANAADTTHYSQESYHSSGGILSRIGIVDPNLPKLLYDTLDPLTVLPPMRGVPPLIAEIPLRNHVEVGGYQFAVSGTSPTTSILWVRHGAAEKWEPDVLFFRLTIAPSIIYADSTSGELWITGFKWASDGVTSSSCDVWVHMRPGQNGYNGRTRWFLREEPKAYADFRNRLR